MKAWLLGGVMVALYLPQAGAGQAETLDALGEGPAILTISGAITRTNIDETAQFDMAMLQALTQHSFKTATPWTEGISRYSGPLMRTLLEHIEAQGDTIHVSALNGFEADIPRRDFTDYDVILALKRDGETIPIREYGPLWILYPFDQDAALLSEKMRVRAVWQVMGIDVR